MNRVPLPQRWPDPPFRVVLVEPDIAGNAGSIARLCAATGSELHLVEPLGFRLTDAHLRRAGLDYWKHVALFRHRSLEAFLGGIPAGARIRLFSTRARRAYTSESFQPGDYLLFGSESRGLPENLLEAYPEETLGIPLLPDRVRSLNLAMATAIVLYEALRRQNAEF